MSQPKDEVKIFKQQVKSVTIEKSLTFQDVAAKIEANNGSEGVDFSSCDLSSIDLHYNTIRSQMPSEKLIRVTWYSSSTHGINLKGARFQNVNLNDAKLEQADFREATLYGAHLKGAKCNDSKFCDSYLVRVQAQKVDFSYCDMRGSYLIEADLSGAILTDAKLQGADLSGAILDNANLSGAKLTEVDMENTSLKGINLYNAWITGTYLTRQQIGERIIQENPNWNSSARNVPGNYAQATSIYRALKNNFLSIGSYHDASWAYVKERKNRKKTHWPPSQARTSYPDEFKQLPNSRWNRLKFYLKHFFAWLLDWIFELSSAYGERPSLTVIWALVFILGFAVVFKFSGQVGGAKTWLDYFNYSLGSFVTMDFKQFEALTPLTQTLTSIEALLGICILALLMFALGNRINRS